MLSTGQIHATKVQKTAASAADLSQSHENFQSAAKLVSFIKAANLQIKQIVTSLAAMTKLQPQILAEIAEVKKKTEDDITGAVKQVKGFIAQLQKQYPGKSLQDIYGIDIREEMEEDLQMFYQSYRQSVYETGLAKIDNYAQGVQGIIYELNQIKKQATETAKKLESHDSASQSTAQLKHLLKKLNYGMDKLIADYKTSKTNSQKLSTVAKNLLSFLKAPFQQLDAKMFDTVSADVIKDEIEIYRDTMINNPRQRWNVAKVKKMYEGIAELDPMDNERVIFTLENYKKLKADTKAGIENKQFTYIDTDNKGNKVRKRITMPKGNAVPFTKRVMITRGKNKEPVLDENRNPTFTEERFVAIEKLDIEKGQAGPEMPISDSQELETETETRKEKIETGPEKGQLRDVHYSVPIIPDGFDKTRHVIRELKRRSGKKDKNGDPVLEKYFVMETLSTEPLQHEMTPDVTPRDVQKKREEYLKTVNREQGEWKNVPSGIRVVTRRDDGKERMFPQLLENPRLWNEIQKKVQSGEFVIEQDPDTGEENYVGKDEETGNKIVYDEDEVWSEYSSQLGPESGMKGFINQKIDLATLPIRDWTELDWAEYEEHPEVEEFKTPGLFIRDELRSREERENPHPLREERKPIEDYPQMTGGKKTRYPEIFRFPKKEKLEIDAEGNPIGISEAERQGYTVTETGGVYYKSVPEKKRRSMLPPEVAGIFKNLIPDTISLWGGVARKGLEKLAAPYLRSEVKHQLAEVKQLVETVMLTIEQYTTTFEDIEQKLMSEGFVTAYAWVLLPSPKAKIEELNDAVKDDLPKLVKILKDLSPEEREKLLPNHTAFRFLNNYVEKKSKAIESGEVGTKMSLDKAISAIEKTITARPEKAEKYQEVLKSLQGLSKSFKGFAEKKKKSLESIDVNNPDQLVKSIPDLKASNFGQEWFTSEDAMEQQRELVDAEDSLAFVFEAEIPKDSIDLELMRQEYTQNDLSTEDSFYDEAGTIVLNTILVKKNSPINIRTVKYLSSKTDLDAEREIDLKLKVPDPGTEQSLQTQIEDYIAKNNIQTPVPEEEMQNIRRIVIQQGGGQETPKYSPDILREVEEFSRKHPNKKLTPDKIKKIIDKGRKEHQPVYVEEQMDEYPEIKAPFTVTAENFNKAITAVLRHNYVALMTPIRSVA